MDRSLRGAVMAFDQRLWAGVTDREVAVLRDLLGRLRANATAPAITEVPS